MELSPTSFTSPFSYSTAIATQPFSNYVLDGGDNIETQGGLSSDASSQFSAAGLMPPRRR